MTMPAARMTDLHLCPMFSGLLPHIGGPILPPCWPTVLIGDLPAARANDMLTCILGPPDMILVGSPTVYIGSQMAARLLDPTAHGGVILMGWPTVLIGP
ncbi:MAG: PAAR domain-containing protein [Acidobacteriaceae bacterium]